MLAAGLVGAAWGQIPQVIQALLLLMALDFVTGLLAGWITRRVSSSVGARGVAKKLAILLGVTMAYILDNQLGLPVAEAAATAWCVTEGISILENLDRAGVPIPSVISDALATSNARKAKRVDPRP